MVYTSLTQVSSPNLHHTSFTYQSHYTRSAPGELGNDDIIAVAQRPLRDEIVVEGASMKTGLAGKAMMITGATRHHGHAAVWQPASGRYSGGVAEC
jgi:hypothetical protein